MFSTTLWDSPIIIPSDKETEAKWKPASKSTLIILSSWNSYPPVVSFTLNQRWSVWHREEEIMCDFQGHIVKYTAPSILASWLTFFGEASCHAVRTLKQPPGANGTSSPACQHLGSGSKFSDDCSPSRHLHCSLVRNWVRTTSGNHSPNPSTQKLK